MKRLRNPCHRALNSYRKNQEEILKRMQNDTLDIISTISEVEFERKNKVSLLNENQIREQKYFWKKSRKELYNNRGVW